MQKLRLFIPLGGDSGVPQDHSLSRKSVNQTKGQLLRINFYIQNRPITRMITTRSHIPICLGEHLFPFLTFFLAHIWFQPFGSSLRSSCCPFIIGYLYLLFTYLNSPPSSMILELSSVSDSSPHPCVISTSSYPTLAPRPLLSSYRSNSISTLLLETCLPCSSGLRPGCPCSV